MLLLDRREADTVMTLNDIFTVSRISSRKMGDGFGRNLVEGWEWEKGDVTH